MIKEALQFEDNLYKLINSSGVNAETAYFILKSVLFDLEKSLSKYMEIENQEVQENEVHDFENDTITYEEKEINNEQSINTNASEYTGSINDN